LNLVAPALPKLFLAKEQTR